MAKDGPQVETRAIPDTMLTRRSYITRIATGPLQALCRRRFGRVNLRLDWTKSVFSSRIFFVRRLAALLLITEQVLIGAGVALPCPCTAVRSLERFPCEHCGCGCRTAEQCWRHCCCYTNQEKIAWARDHGVAVPEYVLAAAEREQAVASKPKCPHCADRIGPSGGACSRTHAANDHGKTENQTPRTPGLRWVDVARCHGVNSYFEVAGPGWPADPPSQLQIRMPLVGRISHQPFSGNPILPPAPPTPPPKSA